MTASHALGLEIRLRSTIVSHAIAPEWLHSYGSYQLPPQQSLQLPLINALGKLGRSALGVCVNRAAVVDTRDGSLRTGGNQRIMAEGLYP